MKTKFILFLTVLLFSASAMAQPKLIPYLIGEKWGYCDSKKKMKIYAAYDEAYPFVDGLAVVAKGNKQGMINELGTEVIPLKYRFIYPFSDGLARIVDDKMNSGYINKKGEEVIACQYKTAENFHEGVAQVGNYGDVFVINTKGEKLSKSYEMITYCTEGYMLFKKYSWGLLDKTGKEVVPAQYYEMGRFSDGLVAVQEEASGLIGFVNANGELSIPFQFENAWMPRFSEGLAAVSKDEKYGFINTKGEWVIEPQFDYAVGFSEGMSCVYKNGRLGFIDKKGKLVIPYKYKAQIEGDFNYYYHNGLCAVYDPEEGGLGFIDKKGKTVIPFEFPYLGTYIYFNDSGLALVSTPDYYLVQGFIDKKGQRYWEGIVAPEEEIEEEYEDDGDD